MPKTIKSLSVPFKKCYSVSEISKPKIAKIDPCNKVITILATNYVNTSKAIKIKHNHFKVSHSHSITIYD